MTAKQPSRIFAPTTETIEEFSDRLVSVLVDSGSSDEPDTTGFESVPLDAPEVGSEARAFIDDILEYLNRESETRRANEIRCHRLAISVHVVMALLFIAELLLSTLGGYFELPGKYTSIATTVMSVVNLGLLQISRKLTNRQKVHHTIAVDSNSVRSHVSHKLGQFLKDGVINGNEFASLRKDFIEYSDRRLEALGQVKQTKLV